jgi:hypothetical protein
VIKNLLTEDYWNITLVNDLETSPTRTPVLFAYYAALNLRARQCFILKTQGIATALTLLLKVRSQELSVITYSLKLI